MPSHSSVLLFVVASLQGSKNSAPGSVITLVTFVFVLPHCWPCTCTNYSAGALFCSNTKDLYTVIFSSTGLTVHFFCHLHLSQSWVSLFNLWRLSFCFSLFQGLSGCGAFPFHTFLRMLLNRPHMWVTGNLQIISFPKL